MARTLPSPDLTAIVNGSMLLSMMSSPESASRPLKALQSIIPFLFGIMILMNLLDNPRLAALHTTDILKLTGAGAAIGVGMVMVGLHYGARRWNRQ